MGVCLETAMCGWMLGRPLPWGRSLWTGAFDAVGDMSVRSGAFDAWNVPGRKDEDDVSQAGCGSASDVGASAASSCSIEVRIS